VPCTSGKCEYDSRDRLPDQEIAEQIAWRDFFGMDGSPYVVSWVRVGDCPDRPVMFLDPTDSNGRCLSGLINNDIQHIWVMEAYDPFKMWKSYSHELLHQFFKITTGDSDRDHTRPEWWSTPERWSVPDEISVRIGRAGVYSVNPNGKGWDAALKN
jgi:hypothetical protein